MKKRRIMLLLVIVLLIAVAAGCSQDGSSTADVTLTLWVAGNTESIQSTFNDVVNQFNDLHQDDIFVQVQYVPWDELQQKLVTSFAGRVGPDVFMHGAAAAAGLADTGQVEPLNQYLEGWEGTTDFIEGYLESGRVGDEYFVLPIQGANRMMIYRQDIFDEVGVSVPQTLDELLEISEQFVIREGNRYVRAATELPTEGIDLQQVWSPFLWSNGGDLFNEDFTAATLTTVEALEALELYKAFFEQELTPLSGMGGQGDQHPLGTGQIAFTIDGVWALEQIRTYTPDAYDKIDIVPPPSGRGGTTTLVGSSGFFMNADSPHKQEAWELMAFIGSAENIEKVSEELKFLPVRKSVIEADFVQEDPLFAKFVELSSTVNGKANPNIPQWTTVRDILARHLERALYGVVSPEEALEAAEQEINETLQN